jgi:hypothetical protein
MADVSVVDKEYGYRLHTGTTIATISTQKLRIKAITCWGTAADTALFTETDGSVIAKVTIAVTAQSQTLDLFGLAVNGLKVTHSASTIESRIILA